MLIYVKLLKQLTLLRTNHTMLILNYLLNLLVLSGTVYLSLATVNGVTGHDAFTNANVITLLIAALVSLFMEWVAGVFTLLVATVTSIITIGVGLIVWIFIASAFTGWVTLALMTHFNLGYNYIPGEMLQNFLVWTLLGWSLSSGSSSSSRSSD
jgi:hypothetical protein